MHTFIFTRVISFETRAFPSVMYLLECIDLFLKNRRIIIISRYSMWTMWGRQTSIPCPCHSCQHNNTFRCAKHDNAINNTCSLSLSLFFVPYFFHCYHRRCPSERAAIIYIAVSSSLVRRWLVSSKHLLSSSIIHDWLRPASREIFCQWLSQVTKQTICDRRVVKAEERREVCVLLIGNVIMRMKMFVFACLMGTTQLTYTFLYKPVFATLQAFGPFNAKSFHLIPF